MMALLPDIIRSVVTTTMLVALLFTLGQPKYGKKVQVIAIIGIISLNFTANLYFYLQNDYTALAKFDIIFFLVVGIAAKPLFSDTIMPWLFNCLTVFNIYGTIVILSYYLCGLFPNPYYAITALRFVLFAAAIWLFYSRLRKIYHQTAERWSIYLVVAAGLFINYAWYFISDGNVEEMLAENFFPLLLLILLAVLVYVAIFRTLQKSTRDAEILAERLTMQAEREYLLLAADNMSQRLKLMDDAAAQNSLAAHDRRHFNNLLLELLEDGERGEAVKLLQKETAAVPKLSRAYCENPAVNAAVCHYAALAKQAGIETEIQLEVPNNIAVDSLELSMVVSNLMENAINACEKLQEGTSPYLRFTCRNAGRLLLEIENPCGECVTLDKNGYPATEEKGHGIGTKSVAAFGKKYDGELLYKIENGIFRVRLLV